MDRNGKGLKSLLLDNVKPAVSQMAECLADWYKLSQTVYLKTQILEKDIRECEHNLTVLKDDLDQVNADLQKDVYPKMLNNGNQLSKIEQKNNIRVNVVVVIMRFVVSVGNFLFYLLLLFLLLFYFLL